MREEDDEHFLKDDESDKIYMDTIHANQMFYSRLPHVIDNKMVVSHRPKPSID